MFAFVLLLSGTCKNLKIFKNKVFFVSIYLINIISLLFYVQFRANEFFDRKYFLDNHLISFQSKEVISISAGLGCINDSIDQGRSYYYSDINIFDCFFTRFTKYSGTGGVIYTYSGAFSMNISYSMFFNCSTSAGGGAIYVFESDNSDLRMVCAHYCVSTSNNFACLGASMKNNVEYISVSYCNPTTTGYYAVYLKDGNMILDKSNISKNKCYQVSGIGIATPSSLSSKYCTFSNNNVSHSICMGFYSNSGTFSYFNIVENNSPGGHGVIFIGGSFQILYSIFYMNQDTLFYINSGSLEVSHCFISHSSTFSSKSSVSAVINNTFTERMTYQIQFFGSHYCDGDSTIPMMTPFQTLVQTMSLQPTLETTPIETMRETLESVMTQTPIMDNLYTLLPEKSIIFLVIGFIILLIICYIGIYHICNKKEPSESDESSSISEYSKKETVKSEKKAESTDSKPNYFSTSNSYHSHNPYIF